MLYAMINEYRVIDIVNAETAPSWPPNQIGNPVIAVECNESVEVGMIYNPTTKEFSEYSPTYIPTQADRIEEKTKNNENSLLTIMEAIADQYEQNLENRLNDQEVQATIYEAVLALSEGGTAE